MIRLINWFVIFLQVILVATTIYIFFSRDSDLVCSADMYSFHLLNLAVLLIIVWLLFIFTDSLIIYFLKSSKNSSTTLRLLNKKRKVRVIRSKSFCTFSLRFYSRKPFCFCSRFCALTFSSIVYRVRLTRPSNDGHRLSRLLFPALP